VGPVGLGLAQLGDDFFSRVPLHGSSPGPAGPQRLSYHLDQFLGSRSVAAIAALGFAFHTLSYGCHPLLEQNLSSSASWGRKKATRDS
jgi:hypothetical protein